MAFKMHIHRADVISGAISVYKAKLKRLVNLGCSHKPAIFIAESREVGSSLGLPRSGENRPYSPDGLVGNTSTAFCPELRRQVGDLQARSPLWSRDPKI